MPEIIITFLFGAAVGSFLNVVVLRFETSERITGRSHCPHCGTTLVWYELVPMFSYLAQRGRCRSCASRLSVQYPLVELGTALLFIAVLFAPHPGVPFDVVGSVFTGGVTAVALVVLHLVIWSLLIVLAVYDLRTTYLPNRFTYAFAGCAFTLSFAHLFLTHTTSSIQYLTALAAGPLCFLPFYALSWFSDGRWMGYGDGKLALGIGWLLGIDGGGSAIMFGFWIGAAVSLLIMLAQRVLARLRHARAGERALSLTSEVPFGPFLVLGTLIVYLTGATMVTLFWSSAML